MWNGQNVSFNDNAEAAVWSFFVAQTAYIEKEVYEIQYPDIRYHSLVPVDMSADKWTQVVTYFSADRAGQANWASAKAQDTSLVEVTRNQYATNVNMATIGYGYDEEELAYAAKLGVNLTTDKAGVARRASEEFIDKVALFGDPTVGYQGLCNNSNVSEAAAPAGAAGSTFWEQKTPAEILFDINGALLGVWLASLTVEMADTLLMPLKEFSYLNTTLLTDLAQITILEWVKKNNAYTAETGLPLTIRGIRGLENTGAGGLGRMIAYRRAPDVVKFHMPMPFEFMAPWRKGPMRFEVPGRFRLGGVDVRRPGSFRYVDGVGNGSGYASE